MAICNILVDFDNFFPRDFTPEVVKKTLEEVVNDVLLVREVDFFRIRLYGGWYQNYSITNRASTIATMIPSFSFFPFFIDRKKILGEIELATTLLNDDYIWGETYEEKDGIPKIIIKSSLGAACEQHGSNCPIRVLQKFTSRTSKKCEMDKCDIVHRDVIKRMGQKCVDSMLVCDILSSSENQECNPIVIMSDDRDIHPAFVASYNKRADKTIEYYMTNRQRLASYNSFLNHYNVHCHLYELDTV